MPVEDAVSLLSSLARVDGQAELVLQLFERLGRDIFDSHVIGAGRDDLHRQLPDQRLELLGAGYEVGLAVHLDQRGDLAARVNVMTDEAFFGLAVRLLGRSGQALLPQKFGGL